VMVLTTVGARPALGHDEAPGILPEGDWTEAQAHAAIDLVDRTEQALPAFSDPSTLEELGFFEFGARAPGGYDHWINPGWFDDGRLLDPNYPEALVFRSTPDGDYVLEAAMFYLSTQHDMSNIPEDLRWLPGWHTHQELCVDDQGRYTGLVLDDGTCASGTPADMPPMMHVWIVDNSCGHRFAGIGVGGIDCDISHENPEHENPDPGGHENPEHENPDPPEHDPDGPQPGEQDDDPGPAPARPARPAGPARPVPGQPDYTC
jgi:hypothetical protein